MVYKKEIIFGLTVNKLIFSKVKFTDTKRFSFNLVSQVSINFPIFSDNVYQLFSPISGSFIIFLGIPNIANPLVVLDFAHPNMEQFAPGIRLLKIRLFVVSSNIIFFVYHIYLIIDWEKEVSFNWFYESCLWKDDYVIFVYDFVF